MSNIPCTSCGSRITVPDGHSRAKIRCENCGYYAEVPPELRSAAPTSPPPAGPAPVRSRELPPKEDESAAGYLMEPLEPKKKPVARPVAQPVPKKAKPNTNAADPRPNFESDEPAGPNLLEGDHIERDGLEATPYTVPGVGLKKCPECRGDLPIDAELCVHCGIELGTKQKKAKREYVAMIKEWDANAPLDLRLKAMIAFLVLNVFWTAAIIFWRDLSAGDIPGLVVFVLMNTALQAFLVGTFDRLQIKRNAKGKTEITRYWRVCFFPIAPQKVDWKVSHGTAIVATHNPGPLEWGIMLYMLGLCCLPGILFYWFVIRPERFDVVLCDLHGATDAAIHRTPNRDRADEICRTINETTGLAYRPVV